MTGTGRRGLDTATGGCDGTVMKIKVTGYRIAVWGAVALALLTAFVLSSQNAEISHRVSSFISERVSERIWPVFTYIRTVGDYQLGTNVDYIIRKLAHFFLFLIITVLFYHGFRSTGFRTGLCFALAGGACALCAVLDELHQLYVGGRGAMISDVWLDCAGGAAAILCIALARMIGRFYVREYRLRQISERKGEKSQ